MKPNLFKNNTVFAILAFSPSGQEWAEAAKKFVTDVERHDLNVDGVVTSKSWRAPSYLPTKTPYQGVYFLDTQNKSKAIANYTPISSLKI